MIELTRLNGNRLAVNGDLILFAEAAPDTLLTMVTGEKLLVAESLGEVAERMVEYRARTMAEAGRLSAGGLAPGSGMGASALAAEKAVAEARSEESADEESAVMMRPRRPAGSDLRQRGSGRN
ncbi:MAG TPA: flagellar FlbD family protein [Silvibacterium sp.]|nr:flagellar FlbD family protein [Silvibacterium sp.]